MKSFNGRLAVVSGGGSGMGRSLVVQLAREGCSVAACDIDAERIAETARIAQQAASGKAKVTAHVCDVASEADWLRFRDEVLVRHSATFVNLLFCNAGIAGGWSFFTTSREQWEKTFNVNFYGCVYGCRTFMPLLVASPEGHVVNTSSVNGFYAYMAPNLPHTAYSAAKFAVKGFTEALITDCRINAPHVQVSLVMPGHVGTKIVGNTAKMLGNRVSAAQIEAFEKDAPVSADEAAAIILDGVKHGKWRILIGEDAKFLDEQVRKTPDEAYEQPFRDTLAAAAAQRAERRNGSGVKL